MKTPEERAKIVEEILEDYLIAVIKATDEARARIQVDVYPQDGVTLMNIEHPHNPMSKEELAKHRIELKALKKATRS